METKISDAALACTTRNLGFTFFVSVPSVGTRGGLALLWCPNVQLDVICLSSNLISCLLYPSDDSAPYTVYFVYGLTIWSERVLFWNSLTELTHNASFPWLCVGDLNAILAPQEKQGGRRFRPSSSAGLATFMDASGAVDVGFVGLLFTWDNSRPGLTHIKERLDRCIVNVNWRIWYPNATVTHLPISASDHSPITLCLRGPNSSLPRQFQFEKFWLVDHSYFTIVEAAWREIFSGSVVAILAHKIRATKAALKQWNRLHFGHIQTAITACFAQIASSQFLHSSLSDLQHITNLKVALDELRKQKEVLWRQKSRV